MSLKASAVTLALLFAGLGCAQAKAPQNQAQHLPSEPLQIETARGPIKLQVEVADDEAERARGLMFRTSLSDTRGMLFEFDKPQVQSFWMQNTLIPLDMIFIGQDGRIVSIIKMAPPKTLDPRTSEGPAVGVLEVRGGLVDKDGIKPGDLVRHPFFSQAH